MEMILRQWTKPPPLENRMGVAQHVAKGEGPRRFESGFPQPRGQIGGG